MVFVDDLQYESIFHYHYQTVNKLRYYIADRTIGRYWLTGHYGCLPVYMMDGSKYPEEGKEDDYNVESSTMILSATIKGLVDLQPFFWH